MSPFITNKQVVFLGDSTFFHSGLIAVSDSIKNNQDITYIILENKTTFYYFALLAWVQGGHPAPLRLFERMLGEHLRGLS